MIPAKCQQCCNHSNPRLLSHAAEAVVIVRRENQHEDEDEEAKALFPSLNKNEPDIALWAMIHSSMEQSTPLPFVRNHNVGSASQDYDRPKTKQVFGHQREVKLLQS
jgi:hypothetical protein